MCLTQLFQQVGDGAQDRLDGALGLAGVVLGLLGAVGRLRDSGGRVRVVPFSVAAALPGCVGEGALYHAGHHHIAVSLGLLLGQLGLGAAQLVHHVVHLLVQPGRVLEGALGVLLGLGRTLRRSHGCIKT